MQLYEKPAISWKLERLRISEAEARASGGKSEKRIELEARISEISDPW